MEGSGVCVACGAGDVELNEETKCPGCASGAAEAPVESGEAAAPAEGGMEAPAEAPAEMPAEGGEEAAPAEGGEM